MAKQICKKFTWVIEDFYSIYSEMYNCEPFLMGDCEWYLSANADYNSLRFRLEVSDSESLPSGWRRYVKLRLFVAKEDSIELELLKDNILWFDQKNKGREFPTSTVPLTEILDENDGFLVNGELTIVAEVKLDDGLKSCDLFNQTQASIDFNGFQILLSQVDYVRCIFERHPDIAVGFRAKNQHLRITSMDLLLNLIETLCVPLQDLSNEDLVDADITLTILKDVGFKVDWLERKLDQVKEKKVKEQSSFARLRELEDSLLKLQLRCADIHDLVKKEEADLSATSAPMSFDDVV